MNTFSQQLIQTRPFLSRLRRLIRSWTSKQREEQFTREEQLWMVVIAHVLILVGVAMIMGLLFEDEWHWPFEDGWLWPPKGFWILELAIIGLSYFAVTGSSEGLIGGLKKVGIGTDRLKSFIESHRHWKEKIQATVLLIVYALQIVALVPLLKATGGPIDSPFAPMALAIAVFTPFIVNKWWTISVIVFSTMAFYAVFVLSFGFGPEAAQAEAGPKQPAAKEAQQEPEAGANKEERPKEESFIAVNLFILGLASVMTLRRRDSRSFTMTRLIAAPRSDVWQYWTDPQCVTRWFGVKNKIDAVIKMDVREGGRWSAAVKGPDGTLSVPWTGTYEEVKKPERLVFTLNSRPDLGNETVWVTLKEFDGKTEMVVRQSDEGRYTELKNGWSVFFDRMEIQLRGEADRGHR